MENRTLPRASVVWIEKYKVPIAMWDSILVGILYDYILKCGGDYS